MRQCISMRNDFGWFLSESLVSCFWLLLPFSQALRCCSDSYGVSRSAVLSYLQCIYFLVCQKFLWQLSAGGVGLACYLNETNPPSNVLNKFRKILMFLNIMLNVKKSNKAGWEKMLAKGLGESFCISRCLHCLKWRLFLKNTFLEMGIGVLLPNLTVDWILYTTNKLFANTSVHDLA